MKKEKTRLAKIVRTVTFYYLYKELRHHYKRLRWLWVTKAPLFLFYRYSIGIPGNWNVEKRYFRDKRRFQEKCINLQLSNDWFTEHIPYWLSVFDQSGFAGRAIEALEIGSWEGLSGNFMLSTLSEARLTCVDTWRGADEHRDGDLVSEETLTSIESKFDSNLFPYKDRVRKYRGKSFSYFAEENPRGKFDFIYIDGSHHCDDVLIDAIKSFEALRPGGVMVFDDYFWRYYSTASQNPAFAINFFLQLKRSSLNIVKFYAQIVIQKKIELS